MRETAYLRDTKFITIGNVSEMQPKHAVLAGFYTDFNIYLK